MGLTNQLVKFFVFGVCNKRYIRALCHSGRNRFARIASRDNKTMLEAKENFADEVQGGMLIFRDREVAMIEDIVSTTWKRTNPAITMTRRKQQHIATT